jgi:16S rRNA (guanine966-N2)-methyltransferase
VRVIAGELRGRRLESVPGTKVRPTSDRVREALFSILGERVRGSSFYDLFAGSGAVGIEALSRGAARCTLVEADQRVADVLERNVVRCGLQDRSTILRQRVERILSDGSLSLDPGSVVFLDPPYASADGPRALEAIGASRDDAGGALLVLEHSSRVEAAGAAGPFERFRTAVYGDTALSLYR